VNAFKLSALAVVGMPLVFACGGDNLTLPSEGQPAHIEILNGSGQSGPVNSELGEHLVAKVTDTQGRPVPDAAVEFVVQEDRGGGTVTPTTPTTNAAGEIAATIHLGTQVGTLTGEARLPADQGETPVAAAFTATALPAGANTIAMVSGDGQSGPVGSTLSDSVVVKVTDGFGNPIPGVTVHWSAEGQGTVSEETTVTGDNGETFVTRTLGPNAGPQTTVASAEGLAGSPVTFTHTANAGDASTIEIVSGNNQTGAAGAQLAEALVVRLLDPGGNPIVNAPVSWVAGDGGGHADPESSPTDGEGKASTHWTLGPTAGSNTLNAVVSGVGRAEFHATASSTTIESSIAITSDQPDPSTVGQEVRVAFSVTGSGGTPTGTVNVKVNGGSESCSASVATGFCNIILNSPGNRRLTATYTGDAHYRGSSDNEDHRVDLVNLPPVANPDQYSTNEDVVLNVDAATGVLANDADLDSPQITAVLDNGPAHGTVTLNPNGSFTYTPAANYSGSDSFTYHTSDGSASSSSVTVGITINPVDDAPLAQNDAYNTPGAGAALTVPDPGVLANDQGLDGPGAEAKNPSDPAQVSINLLSSGGFTYTPDPGATGSDTFTYEVSDGLTSSTGTVTITIMP